ncbi:MAG: hypothetical protein U9N07_04125 [Euryarchaeota archaeon]|nr:hypothetical protein [Euryarchaeota archaeon]
MKSKILLIGLMALTLICCGCVEDGASDVIDEYNEHVDTMNDDLTRLGAIAERVGATYKMAWADEDLTAEEVNQLTDINNEFTNQLELEESHLENFKEFIVNNEQELKDAGVDPYQAKKGIDDTKKRMYQAKKGIDDMNAMLGVFDEIKKHLNTLMDDATKLDAIMDKWNTAYKMAVVDGHFTAEEVNQLIGIATEYREECDVVKLHLASFKEFIVNNEQELKDAGVDTYQLKKHIDKGNSIAVQNMERVIIPELEYAIKYVETSKQEEDIEAVIDLLKLFIPLI